MAFSVQDDFGQVSDANAYITVAFFRSYHTDRGVDLTSYSDSDCESAIVRGTDYMDIRWRYYGIRKQILQTTQWPRYNVIDVDRNPINIIPLEVKRACAEYSIVALTAVLDPIPTRDSTGQRVQAKTTQVGPIMNSVRYTGGGIFVQPTYPVADGYLKNKGLVISTTALARG